MNRLGHLAASQISSHGVLTPGTTVSVALRPLRRAGAGGYVMASASVGTGRDFTVEYRMKEGIDAGLPGHRVVVHQVDGPVTYRAELVPAAA